MHKNFITFFVLLSILGTSLFWNIPTTSLAVIETTTTHQGFEFLAAHKTGEVEVMAVCDKEYGNLIYVLFLDSGTSAQSNMEVIKGGCPDPQN